jgi:hypothetical protein
MPTVGCEADAIAFTEEDASSSSSSSSADSSSTDPLEGLYFTAEGSYSSGELSGLFSLALLSLVYIWLAL